MDRQNSIAKIRISGRRLVQVVCLMGIVVLWAKPMAHFARRTKCQWQAAHLWTQRPQSIQDVQSGEPIAWIRCPSAKLDTLVLLGDTREGLSRFPCLAREKSCQRRVPIIVLGHRDAHFRFLELLHLGDELSLQFVGEEQSQSYVVEHTEILTPTDVREILSQAQDQFPDRLVLMTCFPFKYIGPAPKRYLVWLQWQDPRGPGYR